MAMHRFPFRSVGHFCATQYGSRTLSGVGAHRPAREVEVVDLEDDFPPQYLAEMSDEDGEDYVALLLEVCDYHAPESSHDPSEAA